LASLQNLLSTHILSLDLQYTTYIIWGRLLFSPCSPPELNEALSWVSIVVGDEHHTLADTFSDWQNIIADPSLDRRLASQVVIFEFGMIISGTFFGTQEEFSTLKFEQWLRGKKNVKVTVFEDWVGLAEFWAETETLKVLGGIVSCLYVREILAHFFFPC
jgi:hypothetical protein